MVVRTVGVSPNRMFAVDIIDVEAFVELGLQVNVQVLLHKNGCEGRHSPPSCSLGWKTRMVLRSFANVAFQGCFATFPTLSNNPSSSHTPKILE